ncbi:MAG: AAA family ATPase, partial [Phycisphaerales bacterium]
MADQRGPGKYDTPSRGAGKYENTPKKGESTGGPGRPTTAARPPRGPAGFFLLFGLILLTIIAFNTLGPKPETIDYNQLVAYHQEQSLDSVELGPSAITAEVKSGIESVRDKQVRVLVSPDEASRNEAIRRLNAANIEWKDSGGPSIWVRLLMSPLLFVVIFILLMWFFLIRGLRSASGGGGMIGNFGKSRHRILTKESTNITFDDVAGIAEAKEELQEIVEFLRYPKKFMRLGGRVPRGVLLSGQPGCGKTLLAKAIAGEADVPFFTISGSDFVEMFVGVGAS